jgi:integrase
LEIKKFDGTWPVTLILYKGLADRYVKPVIGGVRLDKLTPAHVQRLVAETRGTQTSRRRPPSATTVQHVYKLVRNALADAYRMELVTRNVAAQVKSPPLARERRPDLTVEDAKRLLSVLHGERLEAFFVLALTTGLRRGELLALQWDDVDLVSRQLRVRRLSSARTASCGRWSPRRLHHGGASCCRSWQSSISASTGGGRTLSAWRSAKPGMSTVLCSHPLLERRSSRGM